MGKKMYVEITGAHADMADATYKGKAGILVANVRQTAIRVVDIANKPPKDKWDLVKSAFPIGEKMNEDTHIFDGCVFANKAGQMRFFMTALPMSVAESMAETGVALFGHAHLLKRLDSVENILFRHYMQQTQHDAEDFWVVFPQGSGLRVLLLAGGLPRAAWHVSCHPQFREDEALRCLRAFNHDLDTGEAGENKTALKRAVVLNTNVDLEWLCSLLTARGIAVEQGEYCLQAFTR